MNALFAWTAAAQTAYYFNNAKRFSELMMMPAAFAMAPYVAFARAFAPPTPAGAATAAAAKAWLSRVRSGRDLAPSRPLGLPAPSPRPSLTQVVTLSNSRTGGGGTALAH